MGALAGALRGKPGLLDWVDISKQNIAKAGESTIKDIWDATSGGIGVYSMYYGSCQSVQKYRYDWENAWAKLQQISDMTEDEFDDDSELVRRQDRDGGNEGEERDGEEEDGEGDGEDGGEEEGEEKDHDGEDEGDEEDS